MAFFSVNIQGQLESGMFPDGERQYCRVNIVHGPDWEILSGIEEGITQISQPCAHAAQDMLQECVWNYPLELCYKSTNVYGWPQLIVSVYGLDFMGRDVIKVWDLLHLTQPLVQGYGCMRLPLCAGRYTKYIPTITPIATTPFAALLSWLRGRRPEFIDSKFVSKGDGREGMLWFNLAAIYNQFY